jgi:hypothetical protein
MHNDGELKVEDSGACVCLYMCVYVQRDIICIHPPTHTTHTPHTVSRRASGIVVNTSQKVVAVIQMLNKLSHDQEVSRSHMLYCVRCFVMCGVQYEVV